MNPRCPFVAGFLLAVSVSVHGQDVVAPDLAAPEAVRGITARELGSHMRFLASDLLKGRDTASEGVQIAAQYLAAQLEAAGAEPVGDNATYFQRFPLEVVTPEAAGTELHLVIQRQDSQRTFPAVLGTDFSLSPRGLAPEELDAPVVFAGYGIVDEESGIDDYKNIDVEGRFVLVYAGRPDTSEETGEAPRPAAGSTSSSAKASAAESRGAIGLLVVDRAAERAPRSFAPENTLRLFGRSSFQLPGRGTSMPQITLSGQIRDQILPEAARTAEIPPPGELDGVRARFRFAAGREAREDRNVIGLIPGADPEKAKEVVIYSAHYDHVGVDSDGEIFNGSDDNASGTSALIELAEAFGAGPRPARSVAFLWVSAEEKGLLGSAWFADHVSLPEGHSIVANINLDMISRNDPAQVGVTPSQAHEDYNSLVPAACQAAETEGLEVQFDIDSYYHRTDSYSFARKGIPVIFFFSGVHEDYHKPTDDIEKADFEKAARITRAAYRLGWQVAQDDELPRKIPGDDQAAETEP